MLAALRLWWTATRGHRLRPWESPYAKWRLETYSGLHAEKIRAKDFVRFGWAERKQILRFLHWSDELNKLAAKNEKPAGKNA